MNRKRREGESYEAYKKSLKDEEKWMKIRLRGRMFWNSLSRGTYKKGMK